MRSSRLFRPELTSILRTPSRQTILTLAIETSCDDTSVAILEKEASGDVSQPARCGTKTILHYHHKVTSDNRAYGGVHPLVAVESHQRNLAMLVKSSLSSLPKQASTTVNIEKTLLVGGEPRMRPDFVTVTRGPGMRGSLQCGIDMAKGLSVGWQVPLLGVNHMQAHALTPRLVASMNGNQGPKFPFVTLLVSGGHTMLVRSAGLCDHHILAETTDMAIGDVLDKCARDVLPKEVLEAGASVMYGRLLEEFAFNDFKYAYAAPSSKKETNRTHTTAYGWAIPPPFCAETGSGEKRNVMEYSFSGIGSTVKRIMEAKPEMEIKERKLLAQETMRVVFEHLISRLFLADTSIFKSTNTASVVLSGGVASNQYLRHILRAMLNARNLNHVEVLCPPVELCTDNAAMIAWTGIEMWEAGWRSGLEMTSIRKWSIDPSHNGGILGSEGWIKV